MNAPVNPNKALWEKGDFTRIAETMRESGEALVQRLGITKGLKVLDLGCGDGTTALPEAKLGADVVGVDIARNLVEAGNRRAAKQGLTNVKFQEGDASNLEQVPDKAFDLVVSIFGAMFAPKPFEVAKEMVRVTRPGGRIVMGNWIPNDTTLEAKILRISSKYNTPPPDGFVRHIPSDVDCNAVTRSNTRLSVRFFVAFAFLAAAAVRWGEVGYRPSADVFLPFGDCARPFVDDAASADSSHAAREPDRRIRPFYRSAFSPGCSRDFRCRPCSRVLQHSQRPGRDGRPRFHLCFQLFPLRLPLRLQHPLRLCRARGFD